VVPPGLDGIGPGVGGVREVVGVGEGLTPVVAVADPDGCGVGAGDEAIGMPTLTDGLALGSTSGSGTHPVRASTAVIAAAAASTEVRGGMPRSYGRPAHRS
jgi:hypothetical protein